MINVAATSMAMSSLRDSAPDPEKMDGDRLERLARLNERAGKQRPSDRWKARVMGQDPDKDNLDSPGEVFEPEDDGLISAYADPDVKQDPDSAQVDSVSRPSSIQRQKDGEGEEEQDAASYEMGMMQRSFANNMNDLGRMMTQAIGEQTPILHKHSQKLDQIGMNTGNMLSLMVAESNRIDPFRQPDYNAIGQGMGGSGGQDALSQMMADENKVQFDEILPEIGNILGLGAGAAGTMWGTGKIAKYVKRKLGIPVKANDLTPDGVNNGGARPSQSNKPTAGNSPGGSAGRSASGGWFSGLKKRFAGARQAMRTTKGKGKAATLAKIGVGAAALFGAYSISDSVRGDATLEDRSLPIGSSREEFDAKVVAAAQGRHLTEGEMAELRYEHLRKLQLLPEQQEYHDNVKTQRLRLEHDPAYLAAYKAAMAAKAEGAEYDRSFEIAAPDLGSWDAERKESELVAGEKYAEEFGFMAKMNDALLGLVAVGTIAGGLRKTKIGKVLGRAFKPSGMQVTGVRPTAQAFNPAPMTSPIAKPRTFAEASGATVTRTSVPKVAGADDALKDVQRATQQVAQKTKVVTETVKATPERLSTVADDALKASKQAVPTAATRTGLPASLSVVKDKAGSFMSKAGQYGKKALGPLSAMLTAVELGSIWTDDELDTETKAKETTKLAAGTAGALAGGKVGAMGGAAAGAAVGSVVPVVGTAIGAAVGGAIGGIGGSIAGYFGGESIADKAWSWFSDEDEREEEAKDAIEKVTQLKSYDPNKEFLEIVQDQNLDEVVSTPVADVVDRHLRRESQRKDEKPAWVQRWEEKNDSAMTHSRSAQNAAVEPEAPGWVQRWQEQNGVEPSVTQAKVTPFQSEPVTEGAKPVPTEQKKSVLGTATSADRPTASGQGQQRVITPEGKKQQRQYFERLAYEAEQEHGIPDGMLRALIQQESSYNPKAKSGAGAHGLMQIVPKWHPNVDPYNNEEAIDYGAKFLKDMYKATGDWDLALASYNAGIGNVRKYGNQIPPFKETQDYVRKITGNVDRYAGQVPDIVGVPKVSKSGNVVSMQQAPEPVGKPDAAEVVAVEQANKSNVVNEGDSITTDATNYANNTMDSLLASSIDSVTKTDVSTTDSSVADTSTNVLYPTDQLFNSYNVTATNAAEALPAVPGTEAVLADATPVTAVSPKRDLVADPVVDEAQEELRKTVEMTAAEQAAALTTSIANITKQQLSIIEPEAPKAGAQTDQTGSALSGGLRSITDIANTAYQMAMGGGAGDLLKSAGVTFGATPAGAGAAPGTQEAPSISTPGMTQSQSVSTVATNEQPVARQKHDPVQSVMMVSDNQQAPPRNISLDELKNNKTPKALVANVTPSITETPSANMDFGITILNTGYI